MKKIILLSDGTGQSAAKQHKTNVWRLYRALNLHQRQSKDDGTPSQDAGTNVDQIGFYDDGVGSQAFLPLKILGGAFGWGIKYNVIELYKALCRTYEAGDEIYLFGFSRGAFTVRMLAGLVADRGLCAAFADEKELHRTARKQFEAYRLNRYGKGWLTLPVRRGLAGSTPKGRVRPKIEFVGVWDTVEAYGFPIEEMSLIWDWLVLPLKFVDQKLSCKVRRACHALAIDEERLSFQPVLFNEEDENKETPRIEQVWFPGVHSDVGGGYPEEALALVPLDWMISRVEVSKENPNGLRFRKRARTEIRKCSDWHGKQHDSRSGLGASYRYKPRDIKDLSRKCGICRPKVHRGVRQRIERRVTPYAPTALPHCSEVVSTRSELNAAEATLEFAKGAMGTALDTVFWRRWLYFALQWAALMAPIVFYRTSWWRPEVFCRDWHAWLVAGGLGSLFWLKKTAPRATLARAGLAWAELKYSGVPDLRPHLSLTGRFRRFLRDQLWVERLRRGLVVAVLAAVALGVAGAGLSRLSFFVQSCCESLCQPTEEPTELTGRKSFFFSIDDSCKATGVTLKAGTQYRFEVAPTGWLYGDYTAAADGFFTWKLLPFVPFRRHVTEPWLKLMGRVGPAGEAFAIGSGPLRFKAESDGELFLYVNDAVLGLWGEDRTLPYRWPKGRNVGTGIVKVRPVE